LGQSVHEWVVATSFKMSVQEILEVAYTRTELAVRTVYFVQVSWQMRRDLGCRCSILSAIGWMVS